MTNKNLVDQIKSAIENISRDNSKRYLKNHFPELYLKLMEKTRFLDKYDVQENKNKRISIFERIYCLERDLQERPMCKICGMHHVNGFIKTENRYRKWCSPKCQASDPDCLEKSKLCRLEKYGDERYNGKEKSRKTRVERYGGNWSPDDFSEKVRQTKLKRYGSETYVNVEKTRLTKLKKYGSGGWNNPDKIAKTTKINHFRNVISKNKFFEPLFSEEDYSNSKISDMMRWRCRKCGMEFSANIDYNIRYAKHQDRLVNCPKCNPRKVITEPKLEIELWKFISQFDTFERNNRKLIRPLEIDMLCENKKIAVEFDGLYWHSIIKKSPMFHLRKTKLCQEKGYRLIHIFEDEWVHKKDIVMGKMKEILGIYDIEVPLNSCFMKEISGSEKDNFLESNNIKGSCHSQINIGLYQNNDLVSVMAFRKSRFPDLSDWEIARYCTKLGYHAPFAFQMLIENFEHKMKPVSISTCCDIRWEDGRYLSSNGFMLDHVTRPNYWYVNFNKLTRLNRMSFQKHLLKRKIRGFDPTLSEKENMKRLHYGIIYDCGEMIFLKRVKRDQT